MGPYTPITAGFAPIAELSRQIANRRGLAADIDASGETKGVLLDVAELWEMYVLSILRKSAAPLTVTHGTRDKSANKKLLYSDVSGQGLGTLIPDAILVSGTTIRGVVDAKYKSLHPSASSPNGPQRDDLYQMAAYLGRFQAPAGLLTWGLLAYRRHNVDCAAFLTGWNPFSREVSEAENRDRQKALAAELTRRSLAFLEGIGQHPSNNWPGEESLLVLGLSLEAAKTLGERFEQNAIVWCGADGVPQLIVLR